MTHFNEILIIIIIIIIIITKFSEQGAQTGFSTPVAVNPLSGPLSYPTLLSWLTLTFL